MLGFSRAQLLNALRRYTRLSKETLSKIEHIAPPDMYTGLELSPFPVAFGVDVHKGNVHEAGKKLAMIRNVLKPYTRYGEYEGYEEPEEQKMDKNAYVEGYLHKAAGLRLPPWESAIAPLAMGVGTVGGGYAGLPMGVHPYVSGAAGGAAGLVLGGILSYYLMRRKGRKQLSSLKGRKALSEQDRRNLAVLEDLKQGGDI
jgi:hypothetical protein